MAALSARHGADHIARSYDPASNWCIGASLGSASLGMRLENLAAADRVGVALSATSHAACAIRSSSWALMASEAGRAYGLARSLSSHPSPRVPLSSRVPLLAVASIQVAPLISFTTKVGKLQPPFVLID